MRIQFYRALKIVHHISQQSLLLDFIQRWLTIITQCFHHQLLYLTGPSDKFIPHIWRWKDKNCVFIVEIKCQLDATDEFLLQILLFAQHVSGTFMPIIRSSRVSIHLLHLVGILFPHIIDDVRSKPHQMCFYYKSLTEKVKTRVLQNAYWVSWFLHLTQIRIWHYQGGRNGWYTLYICERWEVYTQKFHWKIWKLKDPEIEMTY
jgi:hypothetical protein